MNDDKLKHLDNLNEIRSIMERNSSFLSLSGLSGIFAGIFALAGAVISDYYIKLYTNYQWSSTITKLSSANINLALILFGTALIVLTLSLFFGFLFTYRNAKRKKLKIRNKTAELMIINLIIPLIAGGLFILILIKHGVAFMVAGTTLVFYGLALLNASKYTHKEIRYLGITEIIIGLAASLDIGHGLLYWAFGFGIMHIIYGTLMFFRYEYKK